jgi:predicted ATPase
MKLSPNELQNELERVRSNNYQQFVKRVRLRNVRGFHNETVEFKSPVTALVGTNGGGKATILGASALSYKNMRPSQFFPKAFVGDETMKDWSVEIELVNKEIARDRTITRTARFTQSKWRRDDFADAMSSTSRFNEPFLLESRHVSRNFSEAISSNIPFPSSTRTSSTIEL